MKGNIKRLAVLVIITVMATFMMAATAMAGSSIDITGRYAATGSVTCLVAFAGFDDLLIPKDNKGNPPGFDYQLVTCSMEGVFEFYSDRTGHAERPNGPCVIISGPPFAPFAANSNDKWDFTYKVKHNGSVTLTQVPGSHSGIYTSGPLGGDPDDPDDGFPFSNENRDWWGKVSPDGKTIILNAGLPDIITTVNSPENLVCNGSAVLIWLGDIR